MRFFFLICFFSFSLLSLHANSPECLEMAKNLDFIHDVLDVQYAPSLWKQELFGWDLKTEHFKARETIFQAGKLDVKQFHRIVKQFLSSMQDFHVKATFASTEEAWLPFSVRYAEGRYFIASLDREYLPDDLYQIQVGDELLLWEGRPVDDVVKELMESPICKSSYNTLHSLAVKNLTGRRGAEGEAVPRGSIPITTRSKEGGERTYQLIWNYSPERIHYHSPITKKMPSSKSLWLEGSLLCPWSERFQNEPDMGFLPLLGEKCVPVNAKFTAYIYENEEGKNVGCLRIPHYIWEAEDLEEFGETLQVMQENTEGLVIDQTCNYGGKAFHLYLMAAMLTDRPLSTPKHRIALTPVEILNAHRMLHSLNKIENVGEAEEYFGWSGYPVSMELVEFYKEQFRFMIEEWNSGKKLTDPIHILGVDHINPHPAYRYDKPILVLIDELDFSGGDFFPAIMQDNHRALLMGAKTGGAGGYLKVIEFPNHNGIESLSFTVSIAERASSQPLENLGVSPDIPYNISAEDLQTGYKPYISAINQIINQLIK